MAEWAARIVECNVCRDKLATSSLRIHLLTQHEVTQATDVDLAELEERAGHTFVSHWLADRKKLFCPVLGCVGKTTSMWNLCHHFNDRHPLNLVSTTSKSVYLRCRLCGLQTNPGYTRHKKSAYCKEGEECSFHWDRRVWLALALWR